MEDQIAIQVEDSDPESEGREETTSTVAEDKVQVVVPPVRAQSPTL